MKSGQSKRNIADISRGLDGMTRLENFRHENEVGLCKTGVSGDSWERPLSRSRHDSIKMKCKNTSVLRFKCRLMETCHLNEIFRITNLRTF